MVSCIHFGKTYTSGGLGCTLQTAVFDNIHFLKILLSLISRYSKNFICFG